MLLVTDSVLCGCAQQGLIKRDPDAYAEEFGLQVHASRLYAAFCKPLIVCRAPSSATLRRNWRFSECSPSLTHGASAS